MTIKSIIVCSAVVASTLAFSMPTQAKKLSLFNAIDYAVSHEPWLKINQYQQDSTQAESLIAGTYPDPKVSVGLANLPMESFSFNQENMTQIKVGVTQVIPRGDSLALKKKQLATLAKQYPFQRQDRLAQVRVVITESWLKAYAAQESVALIEKDKILFEQLVEISEAKYSSTVGNTSQQDVILAQLGLLRLDDQLTQLSQSIETNKNRMAQWLPITMLTEPLTTDGNPVNALVIFSELEFNELNQLLAKHPGVRAIEQQAKAKAVGIEVAKQSYSPEFAVNVNYGYRSDTQAGANRDDFVSASVTFDVPLFTDNRQDQQVKSAVFATEAVKTEKLLLIQKMQGLYFSELSKLEKIQKRAEFFTQQLLPKMADEAEASLSAYSHDNGDFSNVMQSRIALLNAKIEVLNIQVSEKITVAKLNYYAAGVLSR